ncbi:MAG: hypothetical protein ACHQU0_03780 [Candidatus Paceibacteria bacterium]
MKTVKVPADPDKADQFLSAFYCLDWKSANAGALETIDDMLKSIGYELEVADVDGDEYMIRPVWSKR